MARGGYVDVVSTYDGSTVKDGFGNPVRTRANPNIDYEDYRNQSEDIFPDDVYGRGGRGVNLDPVAPSNPNPSDFMLTGSGSYFDPEPEPDNIVKRSLRPQLRPASFLNESFGDRRQRLAGGPNVFDGAGPSYDVAGLKTVNDVGYDPYVSNAISSVQDYYNDGSVGPTMQNANMLPAAPKNVNDITADYVKFIPPNMRNNLMMGKDFSRSLLHAGVDNIGGIVGLGLDDGVTSAGEQFFQDVSADPLGTLYDIGLGAAKSFNSVLSDGPLYGPYNLSKAVTDQFISSGKNLIQPVTPETNPDQLLGDISVVGAALSPFPKAAKVISSDVDAAQTAQAANFQSAISGTPVPNTGGIMNPRIETNLDPNESMLAKRIIGNAEQDLRSGMSAPEVMAKHDVAVYPQKNAAGETTGHEVMYRFDADRFKYDEEKFAKLPVGEQITLDDVTIESPFKNMGSDIQKNVTLENQKETRIGNLIKGIKEGRGPAGFFDDIHGGIARKTGTGTQIINYNEPQPNLIPHEILHATEQRALNRGLRDAMTGGGSQSKGRRINERIDDLKAQMKAGFPEVGSLEMRMAKMQDAKQEIAALKNISPEAAYMNSVLEAYARSAEGGVDRLGVYDMTRLEALNPKINQANILKRMAQGLGGKDSRAKYVPMTYEMIQGLNPVTTRADALTRSRFNNP